MDIFSLNREKDIPEKKEVPIFKEMGINFETNEPLIHNGDIVIVEKDEALKVWIYRILKTELNKYEIHSENYGNLLREHIGTIYSSSIKDALITEEIKKTLMVNPYIVSVENFEYKYNEDTSGLKVAFQVVSIYGNLEFEGVVL